MSGRLVILRHKSWHVWNQDNQEKVLRDERLAREAEVEKKTEEKQKLQEKNLELLTGEKATTSSSSLKDSRGVKEKSKNGNEITPDKLGELVLEKPWYLKTAPEKNDDRKEDDSEDPMNKYIDSSVPIVELSHLKRKGVDSFSTINIEELRAKRLKREKIERKRAVSMLAEQEIYGSYGKRKKI